MPFFKRENTNPEPPTYDASYAQGIYDYLKANFRSPTDAFKQDGYNINHCAKVLKEAKRLANEVIAIVQENPDITAQALASQLTSDWLDIPTVGADIIKYYPTYDDSRTFQQFKDVYTA